MDGIHLQSLIYKGYARAATKIGLAFDQFRPLSAALPLGNKVATVNMAVDSGKEYTFTSPNEYGDPTWLALIDDATVQTGDYLVGNNGGLSTSTYFIAGKQFLLPVLAIECNRQLKIERQITPISVGAQNYGGMTDGNALPLLGNSTHLWPASILLGGRSQNGAGLPAGVKNAGWKILLPPSVPVTIQSSDIITDDLNRRYAIESAELTDLGWRIQAQEIHA